MTSDMFWELFIDTGDPAAYIMYRETLSEESTDEKTA